MEVSHVAGSGSRESSPPPQNLDAEESILGACFISPKTYFRLVEAGLRGSDFYRESHRFIFDAVSSLSIEGLTPDVITVMARLEDTPPPGNSGDASMLDFIGGRTRLYELAALTPASANASHYARIVSECALKRGLLTAMSHAERAAYGGASFDETLDIHEQHVEKIRSRSVVANNVNSGLKLAERFNAKRKNPPLDEDTGVVSPYSFLSRYRNGSLYVTAGYTGDGKTVTLLDALKTACSNGVRCGYASLEMTGDELVDRLVAKFGVPYEEAQTGRITGENVQAAERAELEIASWDFDVLDDEEVDPTKLRRWAVAGKYDVIFVDHLHRIEFADRFEIEKTVRSIRNLAKRLGIPVIMAAQLNRTSDKKNPFPRPSLSSLRETAVIEQEAAVVAFVYRERDEMGSIMDSTEFIIAKNRFGKTGIRPLLFQGDRQTFTEIARWS